MASFKESILALSLCLKQAQARMWFQWRWYLRNSKCLLISFAFQTTAEKHKDYYVLNGTKFWITNGKNSGVPKIFHALFHSGPYADTLVVYAKTNPNAAKPQHGVTAFLIERGMEGFSSR